MGDAEYRVMQVYANASSVTLHLDMPRQGSLPLLLPVVTALDAFAFALRGDVAVVRSGKLASLRVPTR